MNHAHNGGPRPKQKMGCLRQIFLTALLVATIIPAAPAENRSAWIEVRSPNFIVVTNAKEQQGRSTAYQFEMIRAVFRDLFGKKGSSPELPVTIVAAKDENTLKTLLPEFWAKKNSMHPAGVYLGSTDANYVALRLDVSLDKEADEPFEPVYHEYVHYLTRRLISRLPLWMVEGLAEYYGNTRIETKKVFVGAPSSTNVMLMRETPFLPVSKLFDVDASSPYYHEESKTSIFYAESWALTHYLISRDWKEQTHHLTDFLTLLAKGVDQKEAAQKTIGDPAMLDEALRKYVQGFSMMALRLDPPKIDESGFHARTLSNAESLTVRADFLAHDRHFVEAQAMLEEAMKADPKLGAACESMSFLSLQQGHMDEAAKWSEQAVSLNPQSYWANYYYAWSLLRSHSDEESVGKAETSLRTVVKINPAFAPAYDTLAYALGIPGQHQKLDEAYTMTLNAVDIEPGNIYYRLRAVSLLEQMGKADNAVRVATLVNTMAKTPAEQAAASEALTNAQQFQESQKKAKEFEEAYKKEKETAENASSDAGADPRRNVPTEQPILKRGSVPVRASAEILVTSDPGGVDFGPYLNKAVLPKLQDAWAKLAVPVAPRFDGKKKSETVIELFIQKDGSVGGMKVKETSGNPSLDAAALDGLKAASPFPALPAQFKGKSLGLRFNLSFNATE